MRFDPSPAAIWRKYERDRDYKRSIGLYDRVRRNEALFRALWGDEFDALRARYPREEHKPRLYRRIYSAPERLWRKTVRFAAQAIPHAPTRRRIRRAYN